MIQLNCTYLVSITKTLTNKRKTHVLSFISLWPLKMCYKDCFVFFNIYYMITGETELESEEVDRRKKEEERGNVA